MDTSDRIKIMLDAGHGGRDPGAGTKDINESDLTLDIVLKMKKFAEARNPNWEVILTREEDVYISPDSRRRLCNQVLPTAFVSVHCNASESFTANGCEVIYRDDKDKLLAEAILRAILMSFRLRNRGVKNDEKDLKRTLAILSTPKVPSVIVEPGFLTNTSDLDCLLSTDRMAEAIVAGVELWLQGFEG